MARSRSLSHGEVIADSEEEGRSKSKEKKLEKTTVKVSDDEEMEDVDEGDGNSDDEEEEYEIEAILDAKMGMFKPNEWAYFVSWKGYGPNENSWVSQEDAGNAMELIQEYWKTRPKKETPKGGAAKKRGSVASKRESSVKKDSSGTKPPRKPVSRVQSDESEIEFIEKPANSRLSTKRGTGGHATSAASASEGSDEEMMRASKKGKTNGRPSTTKKVEKDDPESDTLAATGAEDDEEYGNGNTIDMSPYMQQMNWEQLVKHVDTVEKDAKGTLMIFMTLDNGQKASYDMEVVRQRCPQKLISFFTQHLRWKKED